MPETICAALLRQLSISPGIDGYPGIDRPKGSMDTDVVQQWDYVASSLNHFSGHAVVAVE